MADHAASEQDNVVTSVTMPDESKRDLVGELISDIEQIEDNAKLFRGGRNSAYQAVAIQLRNLLLKGRRALLQRVLPDVTLHPLRASALPVREELPGRSIRVVVFGNADISLGPPGQSFVRLPVDRQAEAIPLGTWLEQWVIDPSTKIRSLIEETANEEVAHTQDERGATLERLRNVGVFHANHPNETKGQNPDRYMHQMMIVAIGEYVAERCRELLTAEEQRGKS